MLIRCFYWALQYNFKSDMLNPPALFSLLTIDLVIWSLLCCHVYFKIVSTPRKNAIVFLMSSKLAGFFWFYGLFSQYWLSRSMGTHACTHACFFTCVSVQLYKCHSVRVDVRRLVSVLSFNSVEIRSLFCCTVYSSQTGLGSSWQLSHPCLCFYLRNSASTSGS